MSVALLNVHNMSDPPSLRKPPTDAPADPLAPVPLPPAATASENAAHTAKDGENALPIDWKALVDGALTFLSTASNETLGGCLVGLVGGTYLILGRVGLLLIGVAGGVVLHATWESHAQGEHGPEKSKEARRRELGADIAQRLLAWRDKSVPGTADIQDDADLSVKLYSGQELDFSDFRPETAAALTELTDAIIRDYVKYVCVHKANMLMSLSNSDAGGGIIPSFPPNRCFPIRAARR